jgi:uncharacterized protein (TIGR02687 family)
MTENRIQQALIKLFDRHRIVFWYDDKHEFRDVFESLEMDGIEKAEINANEFMLKHRILRDAPKQPFLLYYEGKEPRHINNWLLDVQLSSAVFRTDQSAIWLSELNLPSDFVDVVTDHEVFFAPGRAPKQAERRKQGLKNLLKPDDLKQHVRLKMLAVCTDLYDLAGVRLEVICECLLNELIEDRQSRFELIERCNLAGVFWEQVERHYGYVSASPSVKDFSIELFKSCYAFSISNPQSKDKATLNTDALVFFKRWKESRRYKQAFEQLSTLYADLLDIENDLNNRDFRDVIEIDYYRFIDQKIISDLVASVSQKTLSKGEVTKYCRERRQGHWYDDFEHLYTAIEAASDFLSTLDTLQLDMASSADAVNGYVKHWYKLDQLYRQFIYALKTSGQVTLLNSLVDVIENLYTNRFLSPLATQWQQKVDAMDNWAVSDVMPQNQFYRRWVEQYVTRGKKICVIISDAFRYEAAQELMGRINSEKFYQAKLDHMLSALPSYTQLGMASLLPISNELITISEKDSTVFIGGAPTQGTANRDKYIKSKVGNTGCAKQAKSIADMTQSEGRELFKNHDVIYIYHNRIDHAGDKMQSEGEAFDATERTFDDLMNLVKKLVNFNASNILITADHGFIYQNQTLDESDFLSAEVNGDIHYRDRRFLLGKELAGPASTRVFSPQQLGLSGEVGALIPKGIQRLRLKGSGSRFVHGGATLQEVIVPVISINKGRADDLAVVEVDLLRGGNNVISAGQLSVTLYQKEPVTDKIKPRELRCGIYNDSGQLISDSHAVTMDLTTDNARDREIKLSFLLTQDADNANNQEVILKLEEPVAGTNQYTEYKQLKYMLRRSFTTDFDF